LARTKAKVGSTAKQVVHAVANLKKLVVLTQHAAQQWRNVNQKLVKQLPKEKHQQNLLIGKRRKRNEKISPSSQRLSLDEIRLRL